MHAMARMSLQIILTEIKPVPKGDILCSPICMTFFIFLYYRERARKERVGWGGWGERERES